VVSVLDFVHKALQICVCEDSKSATHSCSSRHIWEREFSDTNFEKENLVNDLTECFSLYLATGWNWAQ